MKTLLVFLAVIGVSLCAPNPHGLLKHKIDKAPTVHISHRSLMDDMMDFLDLINLDDMQAIVDDHLQNDGAFVVVILYLQGPEWADLVDQILSKPAVQDFIQYLIAAGVPVDFIIAFIRDIIANAVPGTDPDEAASLRSFLDEVEIVLPVVDLINLLLEKLQNSPDIQDLYTEISSEKAHALVEEIRAMPEVQRLAQRLTDMDVKVKEALAILYEFLGWGEPTVKKTPFDLIDDWNDFMKLIPLDEIKDIVDDHLQSDGAFVAVVLYLQGPEWAGLVEQVLSIQAVQDMIQYFTDAGLPNVIQWIHEIIANAKPGTDPDENKSLRDLLDKIEAILPVSDLVNLLNEKLQNSPDFQNMYTKISSPEAHDLVEEIRTMPEVQRIAQRLRDFGAKVDELLAIIYEFLGWGEPKNF